MFHRPVSSEATASPSWQTLLLLQVCPSSLPPAPGRPQQCQGWGGGGGRQQGDRGPGALTPENHVQERRQNCSENYIITAASRERTGIQVAIAFVACGWEGSAPGHAPCCLPAPPSSSQTSQGLGSYFECLLSADGRGGGAGGRGGAGGKRKGEKGQEGFVLHRKGTLGTAEDYRHVNNNHDYRSLPLWVTARTWPLGAPLQGCLD